MDKVRVGIVGCGVISKRYCESLTQAKESVVVTACSDLDMERARVRAGEYGIARACTTEELLADPEIDIVLNLTLPATHATIAGPALEAGKHIYNEKPLTAERDDGRRIMELARAKKLRVGCAPDTVMGGGIQTARALIDRGVIGEPVAATAFMMSRGPERWHPAADAFYARGAGPLFDIGPYYLTALVTLLGPVTDVAGMSSMAAPERTFGTGPREGRKFTVGTPTHVTGSMAFARGAVGTMVMSFAVWAQSHPRIEIYGTEGTMLVPDPNGFGGPVKVRLPSSQDWEERPIVHGFTENSRGLGVVDMAHAIRANRPHRANGDIAFHVLDLMHAFLEASESRAHVKLESTCERPDPLPAGITGWNLD